jgi:hypothetical protein
MTRECDVTCCIPRCEVGFQISPVLSLTSLMYYQVKNVWSYNCIHLYVVMAYVQRLTSTY